MFLIGRGSRLGEPLANLSPDRRSPIGTPLPIRVTSRTIRPNQPNAPRRTPMKVGTAMNMLYELDRPDVAVVQEHFALGDLVETLGFDSLWALEHHFSGYAMSPEPTQLLAYFAGRTKRIQLGTAVIVLPWHDPVRVAEQIALLDIMCGGRCLFGFGRGAASTE